MLEPGEEIKLPVSFYIDPEIIDDQFLKDLSEVTLSYTFYKNTDTPIS
jgi:cytochrome c oxidase assembly protein subunit 11